MMKHIQSAILTVLSSYTNFTTKARRDNMQKVLFLYRPEWETKSVPDTAGISEALG
jgi:hypothetical protein